ncbi:unnamed protein product, partial [marine sediment metagenome]
GSEVEKLLIKNNLTFLSSGREVDVTDYSAIERHGREKKIEWIVNCSTITPSISPLLNCIYIPFAL